MGCSSSRTSRHYGPHTELFLPANSLRRSSPGSRYMYYERDEYDNECCYDPCEYMDRFLRGNIWPRWQPPNAWTMSDFSVIGDVLMEWSSQRGRRGRGMFPALMPAMSPQLMLGGGLGGMGGLVGMGGLGGMGGVVSLGGLGAIGGLGGGMGGLGAMGGVGAMAQLAPLLQLMQLMQPVDERPRGGGAVGGNGRSHHWTIDEWEEYKKERDNLKLMKNFYENVMGTEAEQQKKAMQMAFLKFFSDAQQTVGQENMGGFGGMMGGNPMMMNGMMGGAGMGGMGGMNGMGMGAMNGMGGMGMGMNPMAGMGTMNGMGGMGGMGGGMGGLESMLDGGRRGGGRRGRARSRFRSSGFDLDDDDDDDGYSSRRSRSRRRDRDDDDDMFGRGRKRPPPRRCPPPPRPRPRRPRDDGPSNGNGGGAGGGAGLAHDRDYFSFRSEPPEYSQRQPPEPAFTRGTSAAPPVQSMPAGTAPSSLATAVPDPTSTSSPPSMQQPRESAGTPFRSASVAPGEESHSPSSGFPMPPPMSDPGIGSSARYAAYYSRQYGDDSGIAGPSTFPLGLRPGILKGKAPDFGDLSPGRKVSDIEKKVSFDQAPSSAEEDNSQGGKPSKGTSSGPNSGR